MGQIILNRNTLNSWKQVDSERWMTLALEVLEIFFKVAPKDYEELRKAFIEQNWMKVKSVSHSLKSTCGNVGAETAFTILDEIERDSTGDTSAVGKNIEKLAIVFPEVLSQLEDYKMNLQTQAA